MTFYISCGFFILIILLIGLLFLRRKKIEDELELFYKKNQLVFTNDFPSSVREALGKGNWTCFRSSLVINHKPFLFYWLESIMSSIMVVNGDSQTTIQPFLAIAFPPKTISQEFMLKSLESMKSDSEFKDFFILNTDKPIRVEKLSDGSFLILWKVLQKADVYQKKIDWLEANLS